MDGEIVTFDGVADANAEPIYAASHVTPDSIMEIAHGKSRCGTMLHRKSAPNCAKWAKLP